MPVVSLLRVSFWAYNARGQVKARCEIDPSNGAASDYSCADSKNVPVGIRRWTYTYCTAVDTTQCPRVGLLLSATGPRTDLTQAATYSYYLTNSAVNCGTPGAACYQAGDLHTLTDAAGHVTTIASYDGAGRITRLTDTNGINTDMTYTPRGWLASRSVDGATTRFTYTPYGAVQTITDPDGVTTTYDYDEAHRLVKITDASGNYVQYTLDGAGKKTAEQVYDASGTLHKSLTRTFNGLGQLTKVMDGLNQVVFNASAVDSYDANGNLVQSADGLGTQRKLGYDALNRLAQAIDNYNGADSVTADAKGVFHHNALDLIDGIGDPDGLDTTYAYDGLSNLTQQASPDAGSTRRTFDNAGNVLSRTDAKGITATNTYDALNRLTSTSYPDSTQNVNYAYDEPSSKTGCDVSYPVGRLTRVIQKNVTTVFCYDAHGSVIAKLQTHPFDDTPVDPGYPDFPTRPLPGGGYCRPGMMCISSVAVDVTHYNYTAAGRLSAIVYPTGTKVGYTRGSDGRIQKVSVTFADGSAGTAVSNVTYQPFGPVSSYTLGNGQAITRNYDANYRLTYLRNTSFMVRYQRDTMGRITSRDDYVGLAETYQYDALGRLSTVKDANGDILEAYTYSKAGDRLSKVGSGLATGPYAYQSGTHWLTGIGTSARTYDANGNTTGSSVAGEVWGYGYDNSNRMTVVQRNSATVARISITPLANASPKPSQCRR